MPNRPPRRETRRQFFSKTACLSLSALSAARPLRAATEPFDSLPASVWQNARRNGLVMIHRQTADALSWRTQIAGSREPGKPLIVAGRVFSPDGKTPASGVTVYAYNTDTQGYYGENRTEYPPRLYGWMKTDEAGRFELRTIRPGAYPGMRVPAHIHFVFWGGGYPLQWTDEMKFAGDPFLTNAEQEKDADLGAFRTIQTLTRDGQNIWHGAVQIKLRNTTNFR